ncbi:hypothetical protein [Paenibacillus rhizovicinus]|nr:hypothetical protein [Paenibacillus rhizovicinus]
MFRVYWINAAGHQDESFHGSEKLRDDKIADLESQGITAEWEHTK